MRLTLHPRTALAVTLAFGLAALLGEGVCPRTAWGQGELFVANANSITVYSGTASGNTAPARTLAGEATGLSVPAGVVVDTVNNELVVADFNNDSVTVFSRTASGNTASLRTLVGAATGLSAPVGLVVDTVNNELVVANVSSNSITVYSRSASGNTAPTRTLTGAATGLSNPTFLAVSPQRDAGLQR